jgi:hypothetical protein
MGAREIKYLCCQQAGERKPPAVKDTYPGFRKRYTRIFDSGSLFAERQYTGKQVNDVNEPALSQFRTEIRHFSYVSVLNLTFSAFAIGFGVVYLVAAVSGQTMDPAGQVPEVLQSSRPVLCGEVKVEQCNTRYPVRVT